MIDLKRFRIENDITQDEICEVLQITQPYISAMETGKRPLSLKKYNKLLSKYGELINKYLTENSEVNQIHNNQKSTNMEEKDRIGILENALEAMKTELNNKQEIIKFLMKQIEDAKTTSNSEIKKKEAV